MATRFSFAIFGQSTADLLQGLTLTLKNASGTVVAQSNPAEGQSTIEDNNDGTYYIDGLSTGEFSVLVSNVEQDELKNVPFLDSTSLTDLGKVLTTDDLSTSAVNDNAKVWGGAILTSTFTGKEDVDATIIRQSNIVNNLTSSSTSAPLSALQGKVLEDGKIAISAIIDGLSSTSTTVPLSANQGKVLGDAKLNIADIIDTVASTSTTKPLSANQGKVLDAKIDGHYAQHGGTDVKTFDLGDFSMDGNEINIVSNYSSTNYLNTANSLAQNLSTLDSAIYYGAGSSSGGTNRVAILDVQGESYLDGLVPKDSGSSSSYVYILADEIISSGTTYQHTSKAYYPVKRIDFYKQPWMNQIVWFAKGQTSANAVLMYNKMTCDTVENESTSWSGTTPMIKGNYLNIDGLSSATFYKLFLYLQIDYSGSSVTGTISESMIVVKENITSVGGDTTMTVNNPVVM